MNKRWIVPGHGLLARPEVLGDPPVTFLEVQWIMDHVGLWPERGILDAQLGPNRNGKTW